MSTQHTPGPWEAVYIGCGDWDLKGPVTREDWKLAAAAPDLLQALQLMLETIPPYLHNGECTIPEITIEAVKSAMLKARES